MGRIILDSGGNFSGEVTVRGILVRPSGANWAVVLGDIGGTTVFEASGAADETFFAPITVCADSFNMTTATNITRVILYT